MTTKRLIRISYFTLLTIVGGLIKIQAGPVAFTLQTLFVKIGTPTRPINMYANCEKNPSRAPSTNPDNITNNV